MGAKHGIGVGSGLDALRLAFEAVDVKAGDEVIVPGNTFIATALAVSALGAVPVLVDCDPETYNIDVDLIRRGHHEEDEGDLPGAPVRAGRRPGRRSSRSRPSTA